MLLICELLSDIHDERRWAFLLYHCLTVVVARNSIRVATKTEHANWFSLVFEGEKFCMCSRLALGTAAAVLHVHVICDTLPFIVYWWFCMRCAEASHFRYSVHCKVKDIVKMDYSCSAMLWFFVGLDAVLWEERASGNNALHTLVCYVLTKLALFETKKKRHPTEPARHSIEQERFALKKVNIEARKNVIDFVDWIAHIGLQIIPGLHAFVWIFSVEHWPWFAIFISLLSWKKRLKAFRVNL